MEIRNAIMQMAEQDPQYAPAIDAMEAQLARKPIVPEDLDEAIQVLEFVLQNPDKYEEVRAAAIQDGNIDAKMFPEQFDQVFVVSLLIALYGVQDRLKTQGYARGGLAVAARRLQAAGRGGDSQLAHVNPREAEMLRRMGGSGTINPNTGLREYKDDGNFLSALVPVALSFIAPGLGTAIGASLGASGIGASMLGSAVIGGVSSAFGGGDPIKGALMGGLGGGLGGAVGEATSNAFGFGLGPTGQAILGSGLVGGASGALTGEGFEKGALQGVAGGALGQFAGGTGSPTSFEKGVSSFGNALTAGYDPKTAALVGVASGITNSFQKPSDSVVEGLKTDASTSKPTSLGLNLGDKVIGGLSLINALQKPPDVEQAIKKLSPEQQEYFNRPSVSWDWKKMQADANAANQSLDQFIAYNLPRITGYASNTPGAQQGAYNMNPAPVNKARGGALSAVARFAQGAGSGRADTIDAKLSDGEYVIDAETVAMLGDGSNKEGAKLLDAMRKNIRSHKGKALAKGKFSPNAKSPLAYLKEFA